MKKIIAWIVFSSKDPEKTSLTFKGAILSGATYVLFFTGLFHLNIDATDVNTAAEGVTLGVKGALELVSGIVTVWGVARKMYHTLKGTNKVLNNMN